MKGWSVKIKYSHTFLSPISIFLYYFLFYFFFLFLFAMLYKIFHFIIIAVPLPWLPFCVLCFFLSFFCYVYGRRDWERTGVGDEVWIHTSSTSTFFYYYYSDVDYFSFGFLFLYLQTQFSYACTLYNIPYLLSYPLTIRLYPFPSATTVSLILNPQKEEKKNI